MKTFFNTTVKYQKQNDEGLLKEITEQYLVDAVNFTEAEAKVIEYLPPEVTGGVSVARVSKTNISSIIDNEKGVYFKAKVSYLSVDEEAGKEKKINDFMLIGEESFEKAFLELNNDLQKFTVSVEVESMVKTKILEVVWHDSE